MRHFAAAVTTTPKFESFAIGFDHRDRDRIHELIDDIFDSERWSEGPMTARLEDAWTAHNAASSVAMSSWSGAALAALDFAGVRGQKVIVPSNTFMATPLAVIAAGGAPVFADCRRDDLCLGVDEVARLIAQHRPRAVVVVHIGGHIAFEIAEIAELCKREGVFLLEDCAHAHGASWHGRRAGTWGDAGAYSLYATKTISTGEGGMLVTRDDGLAAHARAFRNYGKPDYRVPGLNFRMSEFTAALGIVQLDRLEEIVAHKNAMAAEHLDPRYAESRLEVPAGMVSGRYKYIVFDPAAPSTGRVYDEPCHRIMGTGDDLPNSDWVAANHSCPPLYYRPEAAS
jgi:dTDP-4-amino-4,6-dideoxygalactose transaminase